MQVVGNISNGGNHHRLPQPIIEIILIIVIGFKI